MFVTSILTNTFRQIIISSIFKTTKMLKQVLESLDLTPKEIKLFLKLFELGTQPASHLARICEMPRNTVRSILDKLIKEGLIIKTKRANTQYYATEKQENIIHNLKIRKAKLNEEFEKKITLLQKYGKELSLQNHSLNHPQITFYEGISGLQKVYEDTLTAKNGLKSWACYEPLVNFDETYFQDYFKRRARKKIHMQSIHPDTPAARQAQKRDKQELRKSILVPKEKFNIQPEIQVYNNKVNITSWKEKLGIIIESEEIAQAMKMIFDLSYEGAKNTKTSLLALNPPQC